MIHATLTGLVADDPTLTPYLDAADARKLTRKQDELCADAFDAAGDDVATWLNEEFGVEFDSLALHALIATIYAEAHCDEDASAMRERYVGYLRDSFVQRHRDTFRDAAMDELAAECRAEGDV